ncbi:peptidylprolyl isomerase [Leptothrix discophora]|uniref:Peptidylprolyl isomerase n=1 Tax=Leptothrix discophora TaxID=89 RepID=A0ABT9G0J8_LEPDI|nr:peptidylprolyl isomerase [Leptothrix discophora]
MSDALPVNPPASQALRQRIAGLPAWTREPLLHFLLLGAAIFGIDHVVNGRAMDARTIVVDAQVDEEARQLFKASRGREPNPAELEALRKAWLDNEVLYREGLALQVDKGDTAIRERVIFKSLSVVDANLKAPPVELQELRRWFEENRAKYDEPARYDFEEAVLAGETGEAAIRAFVEALNKGVAGEQNAGLRAFKGRPQANVQQGYGDAFATELAKAPTGTWMALPSREGWRAIRLDGRQGGKPADFDELRNVVLQDWTDARMSQLRTDAVRALAKKYSIRIEADAR